MLGILVAVALPASVPSLRRKPMFALIFSASFALYAIIPVLDGWAAVITVAVATLASHGMNFVRCSLSGDEFFQNIRHSIGSTRRIVTIAILLALAIAPVAFGWVFFQEGSSAHALTSFVGDDRVSIVASGLLLAVFVGNDLAYLAVRRYLSKLDKEGSSAASIVPSGLHVGWIERAVIFVLMAGGQADAAALAVAAKALFRLP
jgi:hypothetical protein